MSAESFLAIAYLVGILLLMVMGLGCMWFLLKLRIEYRYQLAKHRTKMAHRNAKVGSVLKPKSEVKREEMPPL